MNTQIVSAPVVKQETPPLAPQTNKPLDNSTAVIGSSALGVLSQVPVRPRLTSGGANESKDSGSSVPSAMSPMMVRQPSQLRVGAAGNLRWKREERITHGGLNFAIRSSGIQRYNRDSSQAGKPLGNRAPIDMRIVGEHIYALYPDGAVTRYSLKDDAPEELLAANASSTASEMGGLKINEQYVAYCRTTRDGKDSICCLENKKGSKPIEVIVNGVAAGETPLILEALSFEEGWLFCHFEDGSHRSYNPATGKLVMDIVRKADGHSGYRGATKAAIDARQEEVNRTVSSLSLGITSADRTYSLSPPKSIVVKCKDQSLGMLTSPSASRITEWAPYRDGVMAIHIDGSLVRWEHKPFPEVTKDDDLPVQIGTAFKAAELKKSRDLFVRLLANEQYCVFFRGSDLIIYRSYSDSDAPAVVSLGALATAAQFVDHGNVLKVTFKDNSVRQFDLLEELHKAETAATKDDGKASTTAVTSTTG